MYQDVQIRLAEPDDVERLLDLYEILSPGDERCPQEQAVENLCKISDISGSAVFVACSGSRLLSTCTLIVIPNLTKAGRSYALLENVVTHPDARNAGLGKAILDRACAQAWACGCYKVMLSTGSTSQSVLRFYESAGFEQSRTGFQKRRLPKRAE